jgi:ferritin-like metal-binding protein YciE
MTEAGKTKGDGALESDLGKLFQYQMRDIYFAETAITKALPKMAGAAQSEALRDGFEKHLEQTKEHVRRLEQAFKMIDRKSEGTPCEAIKGILKEGDEVAAKFGGSSACDAALAAAAQSVEHYEITRYGALKAWATELGLGEVADLLDATLEEEIETDQTLNNLAMSDFNHRAMVG